MKTSVCLSLAACGLLAIAAGCGTAPTVTRGQEPLSDPFVRPVSYGTQPQLWEAAADAHNTRIDHYEMPANQPPGSMPYVTDASTGPYYGPASFCPAQNNGNGSYCPPSAECPHCQGCPAPGTTCPFCQCQDPSHSHSHLNGLHDHLHQHFQQQYPQHHFTYSYHRPNNLVYPPPQVPGGAVVYPYYTLKGPSDFFRE
jgi:hypothetical protein